MLTVGSLFSGIGGLDLGLERAGMRVLWQCESDPYCRAVLRKHWPDVPCAEDIRLLADANGGDGSPEYGLEQASRAAVLDPSGAGIFRAPDVLAGGFPCQPVSFAGRRRGVADERWLWPEFARLVRLLRPRYALMENVPGLLVGGGMAEVLGDLAALGYDAEWDCVAAAHVGAPHLRYRVFIVAYRPSSGQLRAVEPEDGDSRSRGSSSDDADASRSAVAVAESERLEEPTVGSVFGARLAGLESRGVLGRGLASNWLVEPDVGRVAHGVPSRVDRLRALGNAVVPQVAEVIGRMIVNDAG